jgi:ABC-type branched-subunit amino acid transport system ATPase component
MKKSILILGRQGAGKTTLLKSLMSEAICSHNGFFCRLSHHQFLRHVERMPLQMFSHIGIDEVATVDDLKNIVEWMSLLDDGCFIVSSCLSINEIPESLLSNFEVKTVEHVS